MKKILFFITAFVVLMIGTTFFYIQNKKKQFNNNNFAAKINQKIISLEEFDEQLNLMIKITNVPYKSKNFNKKKFRSLVLENLIEEKLILEEVQNIDLQIESFEKPPIHLKAMPNYEASYNLQSHNIPINLWENKKKIVVLKSYFFYSLKKTIPVSPEEVTKYYSDNIKIFRNLEKYEIEHIQVSSLEVAEYLKDQVGKGANFTNLINQYSISERIFFGEEKSFIIQKGELPASFEQAILASKDTKDKISLVTTNNGIYLFHLLKVIPEKKLPLSKVREQIIATIRQKKLPAAFEEWLKIKKKNSQILINQQFIENESSI